jgi:4-hydroxyphenylpyruvate dioxygenase
MLYKPAIASMSLGRAWVHKLPNKLDQARANNFQGVEIFFEDLEYIAREESGIPPHATPSVEAQLAAAKTIRSLCDERNLAIIGLQPFLHYEGLLNRHDHDRKIEKLTLWFKIAKLLGTDIIQIPANFLAKNEITGDMSAVVKDLQEVADMGLKEVPVIKFAYENLCWSTYFDTWELGWDLVEKVDRENFGICLDTFNIAGRVYADPASPSGKTPNAEADMRSTLKLMSERVDIKKVFYIQVVDAEKMRAPLVEGHAFYAADQPSRMSWSRNARLFAFEEGGYLPVMNILKTILVDLGYTGWVSMELFSRTMSDPGDDVPRDHARRGMLAWEKLSKEIATWKQ